MSAANTCTTAVSVLGQFSEFVHGEYELAEQAKARLLKLCCLADMLDEEFGSDSISLEVAPEDIHGVLCFETDELMFENGSSHPFFQYIGNADLVKFSKSAGGLLRVSFVVNNLWVPR